MKHLSPTFFLLLIYLLTGFSVPDCNGEEISFIFPDRIQYHEKIRHRVSGKTINETVSVKIMLYEIEKDEQFGDMCYLVYSEVLRHVDIKNGTMNLKFGFKKDIPRFSSPTATLVAQIYNKNFTGESSDRLRPKLLHQIRLNKVILFPYKDREDGDKKPTRAGEEKTVLLSYSPRIIEPEEDLTCRKCHEPTFKQLAEYTYKHVDFVKKHCSNCHMKNYHETLSLQEYATDGLLEFTPLRLGNGYDATITAIDKLLIEETRIIPIEPASIDEFMIDNEVPPVISNIDIVKLEKNVFISIILTWETDKWSMAQVAYGPTGMPFTGIVSEELYAKNHRLEITGLPYKESYNLHITATDMFGNKSKSDNYRFFTLEPINKETEDISSGAAMDISYKIIRIYPFPLDEGENKQSLPEIIKIPPGQLFKNESLTKISRKARVALLFTASSGVKLDIEYTKTASPDEMHEPAELNNILESGFLQCLECHPRNISHPVLFRDVRIPRGLPAAGGKIMVCATCHQPHGGNSPKFIRYESAKEICGRCHKERL